MMPRAWLPEASRLLKGSLPRNALTPRSARSEARSLERLAQAATHEGLGRDIAQILEEMHEPVVFLDWDWRITYFNRNAARVSRFRAEDLHGPTHWELFPDTVGTEIETTYRRAMEQRQEEQYSFFYARFAIWIELRIIPIETGLCLLYRDVTRQKQEEQARAATQRQLEQVLALTTDAVVYLDRNYNFTYLNARAKELLAPGGDVLGASLWESFPETASQEFGYAASFRRSMDQGLEAEFESYYPAPLHAWLSVKSVPAEEGIVVFFRDITEERRQKEALRRQQAEAERQKAEIETVYRTAPVGLALFDPVEFRYLRLNDRQAEFFGLPPEKILGQRVTEMAPIAGLHQMFEQVARGEPVRDQLLEGELVGRPGEHRYWTVNYYPVYGSDGKVQAISAVSLEITRQKQAEAALIQSEKLAAVGRLATSISHEINNPLEAVTNILYLIAMQEELAPAVRGYVEMAQGEVARVSQIATQTLRFHRQAVRPAAVTAEGLVGGVLDLYKRRLANSAIAVEARYASQTSFFCFENDMRQVLNNLIANAIDAMRTGGRLLVRAHEAPDPASGRRGVRITVADTGHGMGAGTQARVFEPFYTTKGLNGTGLGLWISSEIVERHGGRLRVRSSQQPAHRGTVFTLWVPVAGA